MRTQHRCILFILAILFVLHFGLAAAFDKPKERSPKSSELVRNAVRVVVKLQEADGQWPYECVDRYYGGLPIGYRVGGTAIVAQTLLCAAADDKEAQAAVQRGLAYILKQLDHPRMAAYTVDKYDLDNHIWGHGYALEFLCHLRARKAAGENKKKVDAAIKRLVQTLVDEEIEGGGWSYCDHRRSASHVTGPVVQSLLWARSQGEKVPDEVLKRAREALEAGRSDEGSFAYMGQADGSPVAGSISRSVVCETSLVQLGGGSIEAVETAVNNFFENWEELEKRRKKPGIHTPPYGIAPYYFYYGHRYAAQAAQLLPKKKRKELRERLIKPLLEMRDADGTWNDRVFEVDRSYGTCMVLLMLLGDQIPLPPKMEK